MDLSHFNPLDVLGVKTKTGEEYYRVTTDGHSLEGPFLDRECSVPFMPEELAKRLNAGAELHFQTGPAAKLKEFTTPDGLKYRNDKNGVAHRVEPKLSKKERKSKKQWARFSKEMRLTDG